MKILLFVVAPLLLDATTIASQEHYTQHPVVSTVQNDVTISIPPSPECWMGAMKAMHQLERDAFFSHDGSTDSPQSLGSIVCTGMTHDHKKALALELARCQMEDVGRDLFHETTIDCNRPIQSTKTLHSCLSQMTDQGMHSYSLFFTHVHQSCTRLTQEQLMQASQVATEQLHVMLAHQSELWQHQHAQHQQVLESLWSKAEEREREFEKLTRNIEETAEKMKPLLGIESLVSMATNGVTWLASLFFFLGVMNAVWVLTLSKRHDWTRRFMFRVACFEILIECTMHLLVAQGVLADTERTHGIGILRSWTLTLECCLYVLGLIVSVFITTNHKHENAMNETMMEMMQLLAANADQLRKQEPSPRAMHHRVVEVVLPRVEQPFLQPHVKDVVDDPSSGNVLSIPPMYKQVSLPNSSQSTRNITPITAATRESMEHQYAAAYLEALRIISQQTSFPATPSVLVPASYACARKESPSQVSVQVIEEEMDTKDWKKRILDKEDVYKVEEPERKRARK